MSWRRFVLSLLLYPTLAQAPWWSSSSKEGATVGELVGVQRQLPSLLNQSVEFDVDLFKLFDGYEELEKKLRKDPVYGQRWRERQRNQEYLDFTFSPSGTQTAVKLRTLNPKYYSQIISDLQQSAVSAQSKPLDVWKAEILERLASEASAGTDPTKALLGMIQGMGERKAVLGDPRDGKLGERLQRYFSQKLADTSFQNHAEVHDLLNRLQMRGSTTPTVSRSELLLYAYVVGHEEKSWETLRTLLTRSDPDTIDAMRDVNDFVLPRLQVTSKPIRDRFKSELSRYFTTVQNASGSIERNANLEAVRLVEVGPKWGMVRGLIPSNCASQTSAYTTNDPHERGFYIFDAHDQPIGYLQATMVIMGGKQVLYITSADGKDLTEGQLIAAIEGLRQNKNRLGAVAVAVPEDVGAQHLVNRPRLQSVFDYYRELGQRKAVQFQDVALREKITQHESSYNGAVYDQPSHHKAAFLLGDSPISPGAEISSDVKRSSFSSVPAIRLSEINPLELMKLGTSLFAGDHHGSFTRFIDFIRKNRKNFPLEPFQSLLVATKNQSNQNIIEYRRTVQEHLVRLLPPGRERDEFGEIIRKNLEYRGTLEAESAFSPEQIDETIQRNLEAIKSDFKKERLSWPLAAAFASQTKSFLKYAPLRNLLLELLSDPTGIERSGFLISQVDFFEADPELIDAYMKALAVALNQPNLANARGHFLVAVDELILHYPQKKKFHEFLNHLVSANSEGMGWLVTVLLHSEQRNRVLKLIDDSGMINALIQAMRSDLEGKNTRPLLTMLDLLSTDNQINFDSKPFLDAFHDLANRTRTMKELNREEALALHKIMVTLAVNYPRSENVHSLIRTLLTEYPTSYAAGAAAFGLGIALRHHETDEVYLSKPYLEILTGIVEHHPGSAGAAGALLALREAVANNPTRADLITPRMARAATANLSARATSAPIAASILYVRGQIEVVAEAAHLIATVIRLHPGNADWTAPPVRAALLRVAVETSPSAAVQRREALSALAIGMENQISAYSSTDPSILCIGLLGTY
jgi:hypothetical protein